MLERINRGSLVYQLLVLALLLLNTSCVIIPYKPQTEVSSAADAVFDPERTRVTAAPRRLLEQVIDAIHIEDKAIRVIEPQVFASVAFLGEDQTLSRLMTPENCARVSEQLQTEYLVLVGTPERITTDEKGGVVIYIGIYGAGQAEETYSIVASVFDLKEGKPLSSVSSVARGTQAGVGFFYGLFVVPMTDSGAMEGLGRGLVTELRDSAGSGPLAIAVMAAEWVDDMVEIEGWPFR